jgi:hypothetical protein
VFGTISDGSQMPMCRYTLTGLARYRHIHGTSKSLMEQTKRHKQAVFERAYRSANSWKTSQIRFSKVWGKILKILSEVTHDNHVTGHVFQVETRQMQIF